MGDAAVLSRLVGLASAEVSSVRVGSGRWPSPDSGVTCELMESSESAAGGIHGAVDAAMP